MEFDIPLALTDLESPPSRDNVLVPKNVLDVAGMHDVEAAELVERVAYDLCENDALCILEHDVFDPAYACVRDFKSLSAIGRIRLADALCSNLSVLSASVATLLAGGGGDADGASDAVASHREAVKTYATLVYWLAEAADAEARDGNAATDARVETEKLVPLHDNGSKRLPSLRLRSENAFHPLLGFNI